MFCTNCGKEIKDGSAFCTHCGTMLKDEMKDDSALMVTPPQKEGMSEPGSTSKREPVTRNVSPQYQYSPSPNSANPEAIRGKKRMSGGKIAAIIIAAVVVVGCIAGGVYMVIRNQQQHNQAIQAAQSQAAEAQAAAEQAQKDAEAAQAEKEQAQADAEQAQKDAEAAKQAAEDAKSDAAAQAAVIMAAIAAAQDGETITYDGYIFPSDRVYITEADMYYWDQTMALLARNEIYARHGYVFQTDYIQNYFAAQSWYSPDPNYTGTGLSKVEQANADTILAYEKKMGWQ